MQDVHINCKIINTITNLKVTKKEAAAFGRRLPLFYAHPCLCVDSFKIYFYKVYLFCMFDDVFTFLKMFWHVCSIYIWHRPIYSL